MYYSLFTILDDDGIAFHFGRSTIIFITFSIVFLMPAMIAVLLGALYYKAGDLFHSLYVNWEYSWNLNHDYKEISKLTQNYSILYQLMHEVEMLLSPSAFLLLCWQWLNVFVVLVTFFKIENESLSCALYWESIVRLIQGFLINTGVVLCASKISFEVGRVKKTLQFILYSLMNDAVNNHKYIQLVKSMICTEFPSMTAYGFLELKPSLILTSFGSVLTNVSNKLLLFLLLYVCRILGTETKNCNHSEPSLSYLDAAVDMISKAKISFPVCPPVLAKVELTPIDCADVLSSGQNESGVYTVWPKNRVIEGRPLNVFCDMDTDGGGWTVRYLFLILRNDSIFALSNQRLCSIRFDLKAVDGEERYALYDTFWIDDELNNYTLHIKDFSGTAGDSINYKHDNQKFSTKDRDNDRHKNSCANVYKGGWWYNACHDSNLNGVYHRGPHESLADGVNWKSFRGHKESLDTTEMKIRPKSFRKKSTLRENF
ncbi:unnamed protein product [Larinioides sclopetarius]|uniref:Fibrinogen C-terminal domain-containing protein n=1 Tax=Larinioides sclopetarius TaxID=280406 RepID=A0AAV2AUT1_9ARAC